MRSGLSLRRGMPRLNEINLNENFMATKKSLSGSEKNTFVKSVLDVFLNNENRTVTIAGMDTKEVTLQPADEKAAPEPFTANVTISDVDGMFIYLFTRTKKYLMH